MDLSTAAKLASAAAGAAVGGILVAACYAAGPSAATTGGGQPEGRSAGKALTEKMGTSDHLLQSRERREVRDRATWATARSRARET
jgi:hypothetical protein